MTQNAIQLPMRSAIIAAVVVAVLAGCSPAAPVPTSPVGSTSPDATDASKPIDSPSPLVALACDELVPLATIQAVLASDVAPFTASVTGLTDMSQISPALFDTALRQDGGIACLWANSDPVEYAEDFHGASVRILPNAATAWAAAYDHMVVRDDTLGFTGDPLVRYGDASITDCGYDLYYGDCFYDVLIGDYWLQVEVKVNEADFATSDDPAPIVSALVATVGALPAAGEQWLADAETPAACAGVLPLADVRSELGSSALDERFDFADLFTLDWGVVESALASAGGIHCRWVTPDDFADLATFDLAILPGGEWSWDGTAAPAATSLDPTLAATSGVGDAAWGGCRDEYLRCTLHVLDDSSWYVLSAFGPGVTLPGLEALAHTVVD